MSDTAKDALGGVGTALSIVLYASQLPLMRRLVREGDATLPGYSYLPTLGQVAQAGPWCAYAVLINPTIPLLLANFAGLAFAFGYLAVYALYTPSWRGRATILGATLAICAAILALYCGLFLAPSSPPRPTAIVISGVVTILLNQAFWVFPLHGLWLSLHSLDTTRISLLLSLCQLVTLSFWTAYGVVVNDVYVIGNCATAAVLGLVQCTIILVIWRLQRLRGVGADGKPRLLKAAPNAIETLSPLGGIALKVAEPGAEAGAALAPAAAATRSGRTSGSQSGPPSGTAHSC